MKTNTNITQTNNTTKTNKNHDNKAITRIKNWSNYNAGMVDRGHFCKLAKLAVSEIKKEMSSRAWKQHKTAGRPKTYPDALILIIAVFREIFGMSFRETEGFAKDVFKEFGINVPDYSTIERRMGNLHIDLHIDKRRLKGNIRISLDGTGFKTTGEGEWKTHKHGRDKRRIFVKVHYAADFSGEQILGVRVTASSIGDNIEAPNLLKEVKQNIGNKMDNVTIVLGDGAYNTKYLKKLIEEEYHTRLLAPPRIKPHKTEFEKNLIKRTGKQIYIGANEEDNRRCNQVGRANWKNETGYHERSLVETNMFRIKSPFGDKLSCRTIKNQVAQINIRAMLLNMWTNEWMPKYTKP